ncbi:stage III sporulation protein AA [Thermosediminibacter oceani]|uniref:Stage III sporulation protein AA n=1 Tax=Thermosediminibacter oceani (strain ATCC BAA-1034 / DSM 16646 / JW/IW-1228P) TaxID=555079 RepID=D9RXK3_THEOJ|nr:stage III sporulation protein AA [Thermosediminibacter oceani]ADL08077.1 stage III sporulation protein AA [Thermosediminibacter oceani DSM 16646]
MNEKGENQFLVKLEQHISPILPSAIRQIFFKLPPDKLNKVEEIRLRRGRPLMVVAGKQDYMMTPEGVITDDPDRAYIVTGEDAAKIFQLISRSSVYALEEEIKNGYITLKGGHRVGIVGKVILEGGQIKTMKHISGFNIRIAREVLGAADEALRFVIDEKGEFLNTMILSPPKAGKTTLLRDLIRQLSSGNPRLGLKGFKVGVVDERSEIACCYEGVPQNDVGIRTDVLDGCPKARGIMMLLRSMSPDIIATDEIGRTEDVEAMEEALNAGVKLLTTAHGADLEDVGRRPTLRKLIGSNFFDRYLILGFSEGVGTIEKVIEGKNHRIIYDRRNKGVILNAV